MPTASPPAPSRGDPSSSRGSRPPSQSSASVLPGEPGANRQALAARLQAIRADPARAAALQQLLPLRRRRHVKAVLPLCKHLHHHHRMLT
eukprot:5744244-Pyramimonas_sp.AAC.1